MSQSQHDLARLPALGVAVAIIDTGRVLLIKREDFEVWALPGGGVEAGESLAQAALREACEETGLEVALTRLVGIYSRPNWPPSGEHGVLFAAIPVGGALLRGTDGEALDARYFARHELPEALIPGIDGACWMRWMGSAGVRPGPRRRYGRSSAS